MLMDDIPQNHIGLAEQILEFISSADGLELTPDFLDIFSYFKHPDDVEAFEKFKKKNWAYKHKCFKQAAKKLNIPLSFKGLTEVPLKSLTKKYMGQFIQLEQANISSIAPNRPIVERTSYRCTGCGEIQARPPKKGEDNCCSENNYIEDPQPEDIVDAQWLRIQESNRDMSQSKIPISLPIIMKGEDMLWKAGFNQRIKAKGLLKFKIIKTKMGDKELNPYFEALEFDILSGLEEQIELTEADKKRFRQEQQQDEFFDKVVKSFCPWIYGQDVMKEMVLLAIGSMRTDMPLNILIIGDPSTGKSEVMKAGSKLPTQQHYAIMKQSRGTGLTITSVKDPDTDQWTVDAGEMVWAHDWAMFVDEFQAGRQEDIEGLNAVLWDHEIRYNLAGGVRGVFPAKFSLVIGCNPQTGTVNDANIFELLKFVGEKTLPAFITRMTFILYLQDNKNRAHQEQVAGHIFDNISEETKLRRYSEDWEAGVKYQTDTMKCMDMEPIIYDRVSGNKITEEQSHRFGINTLRKLVRYVTEDIKLEDPPKYLRQHFIDYYVNKRMDVTERVNKIVSPRYMSHLMNIARNHGRWCGRPQPDVKDMKYAFHRMMEHMTLIAVDQKTGEVDAGALDGNLPESRMRELDLEQISRKGKGGQIDWACKKAGALHEDEYFTMKELMSFLEQLGNNNKWKETDFPGWIRNGITNGSIKEHGGRYKWTPSEGVIQ